MPDIDRLKTHALVAAVLTVLLSAPLHAACPGFDPPVNYATPGGPQFVAVADLNGDGRFDLVSANTNAVSGSISVFLGNANGTFALANTYQTNNGAPPGSEPVSIAIADFNGDSKLDLFVANRMGPAYILLGNGDGTFATPVANPAGGTSVVAGDFNHDGKADVAYTSSFVRVLLGNGDGTFAGPFTYPAGTLPIALATGDFNVDGKTDLAVVNVSSDDVSILLGNGDGTFAAPVNYGVGSSPRGIVVADFNGDAKQDLAVTNGFGGGVSVLLGNGNGTFAAAIAYTTGGFPQQLAAADFNNDGSPDLAVTNAGSQTVSILSGNGDGTFLPKVDFAADMSPFGIAVADFNGDHRPDLAIGNSGSSDVSVLINACPIPIPVLDPHMLVMLLLAIATVGAASLRR